MIAILDTNAFWGDVHAGRQALSALFSTSDAGLLEEVEIWTPRAVLEELVRQYPARLRRVEKVLGSVESELSANGLDAPELPPSDTEAVLEYRERLELRLNGAHRRLADHPQASARIIDWVASHRSPIKPSTPASLSKTEKDLRHFVKSPTQPVYGVVDAAIWLTVIEAAAVDRVVLVSANSTDFSDPDDKTRPCEGLRRDLDEAGINPDKVTILPSVFEFNRTFVEPIKEAQDRVAAFLADEASLEALKAEIVDAAEWMSFQAPGIGEFGVEVDDASIETLDVEEVQLERADPADAGFFATLEVYGNATLELGIRKADAAGISGDSDIDVWDWDYNETMVRATAFRTVQLRVEARFSERGDGKLDVALSVEEIDV